MRHASLLTRTFSAAALLAATVVFASGCSSSSGTAASAAGDAMGSLSAAAPMIESVTGAVPGLSEAQAALGMGALFGLSKAKMPTDQFEEFADAVPGSEALIDQAAEAGLPAADQLTGMPSIMPVLEQAGISPAMAQQLTPAVGEAVRAVAGDTAADAFLATLQ